MARAARVTVTGCPHHVTQRGNNRQDVFFVDDDRRVFLDLLAEATERFAVTVDGYCLMTNHIHLVATPRTSEGLAAAMKRTNQLYAQYINRLHGRSGHLWQDRFFSCALDEEHFWAALAYVERNPVRARLVRKAWLWPWSSAAAHVGEGPAGELLDMAVWRKRISPAAWRERLTEREDDEAVAHLRLWTSRGRPLGSDRFVARLETLLGRRLRPLACGRPRKAK
jgi:putative transposase